MNTLISTFFAAIVLATSVTAIADDSSKPSRWHGSHHAREMRGMPVIERLTRALHHLDLSEEQRANIHGVLQDMQAEMQPIMQEMQAGHAQLRELIKASSYDETAVASLADKEGELATERVLITSRTVAEIFGLLTVEQRDQLQTMGEQHQHRRGEKRKHKERVSDA